MFDKPFGPTMDVVAAFLHPEIDQTDISTNFPKPYGPGDLSEFNLASDRYQTIWLQKALYGLKQRNVQPRFSRTLSSNGMSGSIVSVDYELLPSRPSVVRAPWIRVRY